MTSDSKLTVFHALQFFSVAFQSKTLLNVAADVKIVLIKTKMF